MRKQIVNYPHTMEYYSTMKRNGLLIDATIWMNIYIIMLNERNQGGKRKHSDDSTYLMQKNWQNQSCC